MNPSSTSAKRTVVIAMTVSAAVVWAGHGAQAHPGPEGILAATVVAVVLAFLADIAPQVASALAIVVLISTFLDNGAGFTHALESLTGKAANG